ncbi:MAG: hypothetical protein E7123_06460 [Bacteroidales bacterium]|nr:hypothetical protein [Bacteroidales bacterium]
MKALDKDILKDVQNLRTMPYATPEGYFDAFKEKMTSDRGISQQKTHVPYFAIAAVFALLLAAGAFFIQRDTQEEFTQEDYIVFSDDMTNAIFYETYEQYADADAVTEEDIIEYLIYTGTEIEELY